MEEKDTIYSEKERTNDEQPVEETHSSEELEQEEKESVSEVEEVDIADLKQKMESLTEEKEQLTERLLRVQAEFDNYRKRTEKEKISERKYKAQDLAVELLPIIDNFERALQTDISDENKGFKEGMQMVYNQLLEALKSQGIEQMNSLHEAFDPNLHHAVMQIEDESVESNTVVEELQKGFILKDKVIRPAMVKVNK